MANPEHVAMLKQGVEVWNQWRREHIEILPDLEQINLNEIKLTGINLRGANLKEAQLYLVILSWADLREVDLTYAKLKDAVLVGADLSNANLKHAYLGWVDLSRANLGGADISDATLSLNNLEGASFIYAQLKNAYLTGSDLSKANFIDANLEGANLAATQIFSSNFSRSNLSNTDFEGAMIGLTTFGGVDLSTARGLDTVEHEGPSFISIDAIINSNGNIPEIFLVKAGVPQSIIEQIPALVGSLKPFDFYSCFISYSSKDQYFAERLYADLQARGVRCWCAPHNMRIGDKIRPRIDEAIRLYDKLLLVLTEHSVASQWVEHEVETALDKEKKFEGKPNVLFPIRLDDKVMESKTGWASHIRLTRHIGDFANWKNHDDYQKAFNRLLRDLKAEA